MIDTYEYNLITDEMMCNPTEERHEEHGPDHVYTDAEIDLPALSTF